MHTTFWMYSKSQIAVVYLFTSWHQQFTSKRNVSMEERARAHFLFNLTGLFGIPFYALPCIPVYVSVITVVLPLSGCFHSFERNTRRADSIRLRLPFPCALRSASPSFHVTINRTRKNCYLFRVKMIIPNPKAGRTHVLKTHGSTPHNGKVRWVNSHQERAQILSSRHFPLSYHLQGFKKAVWRLWISTFPTLPGVTSIHIFTLKSCI